MTEMTKRHNDLVGVIRRAIKENKAETFLSKIGDNTVIRREGFSEEVRSLRPDLCFETRSFGSNPKVIIDIAGYINTYAGPV
jgi:hypothetical protein